ncbi:hypothetical protein AKJ37_02485 [candidate division MSBL1 archaeon SCGC-AAA259I09]|uniref:Uncharacterized protein n=1 Tax=candidate division MSBL1 archaeon SCGC-AAA259I09 TaxID=1698267 RepID=A0A133UU78_9EURY|nr:hypothetical protein AKJ37_02485 [candidate division MSBL1 archaeon SCGC-AAA259I09]
MVRERFIPYLMTTSLRKILRTLGSEYKITALKTNGVYTPGEAEGEEDAFREETEYSHLGMTVYERTRLETEIDYLGAGVDGDALTSMLDEWNIHDMSVKEMRVKIGSPEREFIEKVRRPWPKRSDGLRTDVLENLHIPMDSKWYIDFVNRGFEGDPSDYKVNSRNTWGEQWNSLNRCEVCEKPLQVHGFKQRSMNVRKHGIGSEYITGSIPRKKMPEINAWSGGSGLPQWLHENITEPSGYASPNGQYHYRLGTEDQWVLEEV